MNDFYDEIFRAIEKSTREIIFNYPFDLTHLEQRAKEDGDKQAQALLDILPHVHAIRAEFKKLGLFNENQR